LRDANSKINRGSVPAIPRFLNAANSGVDEFFGSEGIPLASTQSARPILQLADSSQYFVRQPLNVSGHIERQVQEFQGSRTLLDADLKGFQAGLS
jgi:hypothetical protein